MTAMFRPFATQYLRFPPVANEDRTVMSISNYDDKPPPVLVPPSCFPKSTYQNSLKSANGQSLG
ncbi:MAG: hypothetical protein LBL06_02145 [Treponema sp.]|nr:hypothetical protein [Treponema sp.]